MKYKVAELDGALLDAAVQKCYRQAFADLNANIGTDGGYTPGMVVAGAPIGAVQIEREDLAGLRAYVASHVGDEIDL